MLPISVTSEVRALPILVTSEVGALPILVTGGVRVLPILVTGEVGALPILVTGEVGALPILVTGEILRFCMHESGNSARRIIIAQGFLLISARCCRELGESLLERMRLADGQEITMSTISTTCQLVVDMASWVQSWTSYVVIATASMPERANELWSYQDIILLFQQYKADSVLAYGQV